MARLVGFMCNVMCDVRIFNLLCVMKNVLISRKKKRRKVSMFFGLWPGFGGIGFYVGKLNRIENEKMSSKVGLRRKSTESQSGKIMSMRIRD